MTFFVHGAARVGRGPGIGKGALVVLLAMLATPRAWTAERMELRVGGHPLAVEVARTPAQRSQGLMGRPPLSDGDGMLFVFAGEAERCLWMRDTPSALAAAFISAEGQILNVVEMQPLSDTHHCSRAPARYALEARSGWFSARGLGRGERIQGLQAVAPAAR